MSNPSPDSSEELREAPACAPPIDQITDEAVAELVAAVNELTAAVLQAQSVIERVVAESVAPIHAQLAQQSRPAGDITVH